MIEKSTLISGRSLPESDAARTGADFGTAVSPSALKEGFSKIPEDESDNHMQPMHSPEGSGFVGRPHGWER